MKISTFCICIMFFLCSCHQHEWTYEIKENCRYPDFYSIKPSFRPLKVKINVTGNLNKSANLVWQISNSERELGINKKIYLPKGKIKIVDGNDFYTEGINIIYLPIHNSTSGNLKIKVEIY